jgi:hypothetical protein
MATFCLTAEFGRTSQVNKKVRLKIPDSSYYFNKRIKVKNKNRFFSRLLPGSEGKENRNNSEVEEILREQIGGYLKVELKIPDSGKYGVERLRQNL